MRFGSCWKKASANLLAAGLLSLAGCCALPEAAPGRARVVLIAGSLPGASKGFGQVAARLRAEGMNVVRANRWDRWRIARALVEEANSGAAGSAVVLVGHSGGGRDAVYVSRRLAERGVGVDGLICLDTAWADPVPGNVRRAVHLYVPGKRYYPARPLVYEAGTAREAVNIDLRPLLAQEQLRGAVHGKLDDQPEVQDVIIREVLQAARDGGFAVRSPSSGRGPRGTVPGAAE